MFNSGRVVTIVFSFLMLLVGACADTRTSAELQADIFASIKKFQREQIAAGKGDYMASVYESIGASEYDKAITKCEEYREIRPDDPTLFMWEGAAYNLKGDFSSAISSLSKAITLNNTLWPAYYWRGLSYQDAGEHRKFLEDFDTLAGSEAAPGQILQFYERFGKQTDTEDSMKGVILFHRAVALAYLGETASAIASINRAISYGPAYSTFYLMRAEFYIKQQDYGLAYSDARKAMELSPGATNGWNLAGWISFTLGNYSNASREFGKEYELGNVEAAVLTNLGLAYWQQGEQVKAFEAMGQALRGEPADSTYYHTAYFHHINGRQEKALEYYRKSYDLNRDILNKYTSKMNSTPATSPTREFYKDELAVARIYITTGSTPAEITYKKRATTFEITEITLVPDPVPVNKNFDFHVNFKVDIPNSPDHIIPTVLNFKILRGSKVLHTSKSYFIDANNGASKKWALHMNPVRTPGTYAIHVTIKYKNMVSEDSTKLHIQ